MVTCKACGAKVSDQYGYCTNCLAPFDVAVVPSNIPPACRVCGRDMFCVDHEAQRWYCYGDDQTFLAKENRWVESQLIPPLAPLKYSEQDKFVMKLLKPAIIGIILVNAGIFLLSFWVPFMSRFVGFLIAITIGLVVWYAQVLGQISKTKL